MRVERRVHHVSIGTARWAAACLAASTFSGATAGPTVPPATVQHATAPVLQASAVDVALVVSIDVSESVDEARYRLQMNGIADALEDSGVIATLTSGPLGAIAFAMVAWSDKSEVAVPWTRISSRADAEAVATQVRNLPRYGGEFTCLARMLQYLDERVIPEAPVRASRMVVDVSGDGIDNCSEPAAVSARRDVLVAAGATINGLPIVEDPERIVGSGAYRAPGGGLGYIRPLEDPEQLTLEAWYRKHVTGGNFSFVLPANGYGDFARAIRQKFVTEISAAPSTPSRSSVTAR